MFKEALKMNERNPFLNIQEIVIVIADFDKVSFN